MKICKTCGQTVSERIIICPACGGSMGQGTHQIDDYRILEVIHEGYATILFKAVRSGEEKPIMLRLFTTRSGVDDTVAQRLEKEIVELKKLPAGGFVNHQEIKRSTMGLWYRVSEWVEAISWGDLMVSGRLKSFSSAFDLFHKIARYIQILHEHGHTIPHLNLNDIMVIRKDNDELDVKIDYKMSRFLDPAMARPGPMLKIVLQCHPDLKNEKPLDFKSDIWSLGKVFVEILTADYNICNHSEKADKLPLPHDIKVFLKSMLADEPDLRPGSLEEIANKLKSFKSYDFDDFARSCGWSAPSPAFRKRKRGYRATLVAAAIVAISLVGLILLISRLQNGNGEAKLFQYANRYADAVAFLAVTYWIESGNEIFYQNSTEGTAFLVDNAGFLLTNRHVACPWLEDRSLMYVIARLKDDGVPFAFDYRIYLWFEGQKAFYQSLEQKGFDDPTEKYFIQTAFRSDGQPGVSIAGVARVPEKTGYLINSPLRDDFAVLKIDQVPRNLKPLPMDKKMNPRKISRLYPVITLGFPLGSQTQAASVNVSVTRGHVRRSFESMLQVDTSIHKGNSGGPIIDARGLVIGIASGVATMRAPGPVPINTPLPDIGMVLPIGKAVTFLDQLKEGDVKWNGVLDVMLDQKTERINRLALENEWETAAELSDEILLDSPQPALFLYSAMMHYCNGDFRRARERFKQFLSMDEENNLPRFMLFLLDWMDNKSERNEYREHLLALNWRSRDEFLGYLTKILAGKINEEEAGQGWETLSEKSWIDFVRSLISINSGDRKSAEAFIREAGNNAAVDDWCMFLVHAQITKLQQQRLRRIAYPDLRDKYLSEIQAFWQRMEEENDRKRDRKGQKAVKLAQISRRDVDTNIKLKLLEEIMEADSQDGTVRANLAFYHAMNGDWSGALAHVRQFLNKNGRESAYRLSIGLLEPEILNKLGMKSEADTALKAFKARTQDRWYQTISQSLLDESGRFDLEARAADNPENMLTAHMALGLWAEGGDTPSLALRHYRAALESYLDDWMEYDFAKERIKVLKLNAVGRPRKGNHISDILDTGQHHQ